MQEFNKIKIVLTTITFLILGFVFHFGVVFSSDDHEFELISQNITEVQSQQLTDQELRASSNHKEWGVSFTEFNPTTGTIQNTLFTEGNYYSSTKSIDSENILLGKN